MQILYSYFRYTGRLFLGCALFVACWNIIRASWETKKERLSFRRKYIEELVWGISPFWLHLLLSMSFCCFLCLLSAPLKWRTCGIAPIKICSSAMGSILCDDISERLKIWKSQLFWLRPYINQKELHIKCLFVFTKVLVKNKKLQTRW